MNRTALSILFSALLSVAASAMAPISIQVVTETSGVCYRIGGTAPGLSREDLAKWFAESKPWGPEPVLIYIDAATTFFTVSDLLSLLKDTGGVEQFEVYVSAEPKGEPRTRVTYALRLSSSHLASPTREPLPPPDDTPENALNRLLATPPSMPQAPRVK